MPAPATGPHAVPVGLHYSRSRGAEICPDEQGIRDAVAENVGWDLFTTNAARTVLVNIQRKGARFVASMELRNAAGELQWEHDPPLSRADCRALARVIGLVIAVLLDPFTVPPPLPAPAPPPTPKPPEPAPPPPPPQAAPLANSPPRRPPREVAGLYVGGDVLFNPILAPIGSAGGSLWLALRLRQPAMSIELGLRGLGSLGAAQEQYPARSVYVADRWTYVSGVVAAIAHSGPVFFGPMFEVGSLSAGTDAFSSSTLQTANPRVLGAGVHAGVEAQVADGIVVRSSIEGEWLPVGPFVDTRYSQFLRTGPSLSATVAIGVAFHLWSPGEGSR